MTAQWKPGDVALVQNGYGVWNRAICQVRPNGGVWVLGGVYGHLPLDAPARSLAVIDPENLAQVERLRDALWKGGLLDMWQDRLREFANTQEPTSPAARVTDFRDNIWRLLADGDWVCTSGPDVGEYLIWSQLASERGPLTVEVTS